MRILNHLALSLTLLLLAVGTNIQAQIYPRATGYVSDFAHVLTTEQGSSLNAELIAFEANTTIEIAVVTVVSLDGKTPEAFAVGMATEWGVGKKNKNNGVIFLIAPTERKMYIQPASGLREKLTQSRLESIRDRYIIPQFKRGNMATGIIDGAHQIINLLTVKPQTASSSTEETPVVNSHTEEPPLLFVWTDEFANSLLIVVGVLICLAIVIGIVIFLLLRSSARDYFLQEVIDIKEQIAKINKLKSNKDVKSSRWDELARTEKKFSEFSYLTKRDIVNWFNKKSDIDTLSQTLENLQQNIEMDINNAVTERESKVYVLKVIPEIKVKIEFIETLKSNPDVRQDYQVELKSVRDAYSEFAAIDVNDNLNWFNEKNKINRFISVVDKLQQNIQDEINFAEHARIEGPKLFEKMPDLIASLEKKVKEGKHSKKADEYLNKARQDYEQARVQQSGMSNTDWLILYMLLSQSNSNCQQAESAYIHDNTYHPSSSPVSDDSYKSPASIDFGFGSSTTFGGGGGGFDGGGGAGGSW